MFTEGGTRKKTRWLWVCLGIELIFLAYCYVLFNFLGQWTLNFLMIPDYLYVFLAGCAVYYLNYSEDLQQKRMMILYLIICTLLCKYLCFISTFVFFIIWIFALVVFSSDKINQKTDKMKKILRPLVFISESSYVLYLTHQFIGFGIIRLIEANGMITEFWVLLPILHAILLAAILHYCVELKINAVIKNHFAKVKIAS